MIRKLFWRLTTLEIISHLSQAFCRWHTGSAEVLLSPCCAWRWTAGFGGKSAGKNCCSTLQMGSPPLQPLHQVSLHRFQQVLFSVKLILEQGHHKINKEIIMILHHLAGLFPLYQRTALRGHLRPLGDVPSSLLPSLAPYISHLITCETQSRGLWCYCITKSRFIWTWEASQGFMICMAPFLSVNLFVTFILGNFLSFLTPLHLFPTIQKLGVLFHRTARMKSLHLNHGLQ